MGKPRPYNTWENDPIRLVIEKPFGTWERVRVECPAYRNSTAIHDTKRLRKMAAWMVRAADYLDQSRGNKR